ncbi:MAG: DUF4350 domain-containing protein [Candidatus Andeanibacterium colombiense]|uniref:DUF4350 domain-containing protein n=1 Tax=Candidatus Andeanibacterium colombiense TaxID=3121345 RepID=A0AAJ5X8V8_9SPHN|nr:MAG: DUF4350 domain-containing protein [Sphingomonadaceae bacterium]
MSAGGQSFSPRAVLTLLVLGAAAFIGALYFIGAGDSREIRADGGGHGAGTGLNGYAALAGLLSAQGHEVHNIRSKAQLSERNLLILTPPDVIDGKKLQRLVDDRRHAGPTVIVLPKWSAIPADRLPGSKARHGWVLLGGASVPHWPDFYDDISVGLAPLKGEPAWRGGGLSGALPDRSQVLSGRGAMLEPLVTTPEGAVLAGYINDGGIHPKLEAMAGTAEDRLGEDDTLYPVVMVFEPDLMNNYGLADRTRAMLALRILEAASERENLPVAFDLTLNGYGESDNLLTLAFRPPFLAATLCFLIAALVVGWRAFRRFGPPVASASGLAIGRKQLAAGGIYALAAVSTFAFGKRELATNGAALIQRAKRLHLLGAPYAALVRTRVAQALGLKPSADVALTERTIDQLLERRGAAPEFAAQAEALRQARGPHELLRRAHALREIERNLSR